MLKLKSSKTLQVVLKHCKANNTIYKHFFIGMVNIANEKRVGTLEECNLLKVRMLKNGISVFNDFAWFMKVRG